MLAMKAGPQESQLDGVAVTDWPRKQKARPNDFSPPAVGQSRPTLSQCRAFGFVDRDHLARVRFGQLTPADNVIGATHTRWKCLILLPTKYAIGGIPSSNLWQIISATSAIAGCIVTCLHARFASDSTLRFRPKEPISTGC